MTGETAACDPRRDYVAELQRWTDAGATWQVVSWTACGATVALLRCDGGEEVGRFTSNDPRLLAFVEQGRDETEREG
ncbi:MAG: hypothetical protein ABW137_29645 [Mycobacterium sp.]